MKNLEQILETGNKAERALVKLVDAYPTNPGAILREKFVKSTLGITISAAVFTGFSALQIANGFDIFYSAFTGFGFLGAVNNIINIKKNLEAYKYFSDENLWSKIIPNTNEALFYRYKDSLTYNPTPVEIIFGERVHPIENLNNFEGLNGTYFFHDVKMDMIETRRENIGMEHPIFKDLTYFNTSITLEKCNLHFDISSQDAVKNAENLSFNKYVLVQLSDGKIVGFEGYGANFEKKDFFKLTENDNANTKEFYGME